MCVCVRVCVYMRVCAYVHVYVHNYVYRFEGINNQWNDMVYYNPCAIGQTNFRSFPFSFFLILTLAINTVNLVTQHIMNA